MIEVFEDCGCVAGVRSVAGSPGIEASEDSQLRSVSAVTGLVGCGGLVFHVGATTALRTSSGNAMRGHGNICERQSSSPALVMSHAAASMASGETLRSFEDCSIASRYRSVVASNDEAVGTDDPIDVDACSAINRQRAALVAGPHFPSI